MILLSVAALSALIGQAIDYAVHSSPGTAHDSKGIGKRLLRLITCTACCYSVFGLGLSLVLGTTLAEQHGFAPWLVIIVFSFVSIGTMGWAVWKLTSPTSWEVDECGLESASP